MFTRIFHRNLGGGALYYVIFISFILASIVVFFLMLRAMKCRNTREELNYYQKVDNIESALVLYLSKPEEYQGKDSVTIFPEDSASPVYIYRNHWSLYDRITAETKYRGKTLSRTILAGMDPFSCDSLALWVPENRQTLYASGGTSITGNARLPSRGIQRASIEGKPLTTSSPVHGNITKSNRNNLPVPCTSILRKILSSRDVDSLFAYGTLVNDAEYELLHNDFSLATQWLCSQKDIHLTDFVSTGNIGIISTQSIRIEKESELERCIVSATNIQISNGFKGSVQLFAEDTIKIGRNCTLTYPSLICLFNDDINNVYVEIGESCDINGAIIVFQQGSAAEKPWLKIGKGTIVTGQVYHRGTVENYGTIYGSLWCSDFYLKTPRAYYLNHFLDNVIDYSKVPEDFVFIDLLGGKSTQVLDFLDEDY